MIDGIILFFTFTLFLFSFLKLLKNDKFFSIFYGALFLYLFPCLIVYRFMPSVLGIYYAGKEYYYSFAGFSLLSLFLTWMMLYSCSRHIKKSFIIVEQKEPIKGLKEITMGFIVVFSLFETYLIVKNYNNISYHNLVFNYLYNNRDLKILSYLYEVSKLLIVLYATRIHDLKKKSFLYNVFLIYMISQYALYSFLAGDRSGTVALAIGLFIIFFNKKQVNFKRMVLIIAIGIGLLLFMRFILSNRSSAVVEKSFVELLLIGDYTYPALYIPQMIKNNYINPVELVKSNILNSIIFTNYPYLYYTAGEVFMPGVTSVSEGLGFYLFTEGYIFAGWFGIIWNCFLIPGLLIGWRTIANTNNPSMNTAILGVMSTYLIQIARSSGSLAFIKNLYLFILPSIILYCFLYGLRIHLRIGTWRIK